ncbi:MAG: hypothetical protein ACRDGB_02655 [Candidatus Limnocylindria bacterium]
MLGATSVSRGRYRWVAGSADATLPTTPGGLRSPAVTQTLFRALVGAAALVVVLRFEAYEPRHLALATVLGAAWLCTSSLVHYTALRVIRWSYAMRRAPTIPLRFAGPTGRFTLRRLDLGTKVEVRAGIDLIAEVTAADDGDEVVVRDVGTITATELSELGSAIGQAMEITAAATRRRRRGRVRV